jgi:hypothetical protein
MDEKFLTKEDLKSEGYSDPMIETILDFVGEIGIDSFTLGTIVKKTMDMEEAEEFAVIDPDGELVRLEESFMFEGLEHYELLPGSVLISFYHTEENESIADILKVVES